MDIATVLGREITIQEYIHVFHEKTNSERISVICKEKDHFDLFVIHADTSRSASEEVHRNIIGAVAVGANRDCGAQVNSIVALMPIREMEAWALADADALAKACGLASWPSRIIRPHAVEQLEDPKATLNELIGSLTGRRRLRPSEFEVYLERISVELSFDALRRLESFRRFESALRSAIESKLAR